MSPLSLAFGIGYIKKVKACNNYAAINAYAGDRSFIRRWLGNFKSSVIHASLCYVMGFRSQRRQLQRQLFRAISLWVSQLVSLLNVTYLRAWCCCVCICRIPMRDVEMLCCCACICQTLTRDVEVRWLFGVVSPCALFQASDSFTGAQPGYVFYMGNKGWLNPWIHMDTIGMWTWK